MAEEEKFHSLQFDQFLLQVSEEVKLQEQITRGDLNLIILDVLDTQILNVSMEEIPDFIERYKYIVNSPLNLEELVMSEELKKHTRSPEEQLSDLELDVNRYNI